MRREDELISRLSDRLDEEIKNLPKDGKDHELRIKIIGDHGNINLGKQKFEIHSGLKQPPPEGSDMARQCPQCENTAWRFTKLCMHCDYDFHIHDEVEAQQQEERRRQAVNLTMLKIFVACVVIAICSFLVKDYLPLSWQNWAIGVTVVAGFIAFIILQSPDK